MISTPLCHIIVHNTRRARNEQSSLDYTTLGWPSYALADEFECELDFIMSLRGVHSSDNVNTTALRQCDP